ncbi:hypothetical protein M406DRAFT_47604 [Cryphonectria parasitica EP155]|uniref:Mediator of RNA polymerase II transcription subunit 1 n=1 Tax=Cryphonectria parasitica (strain ATCC 38755 / EP155) TaxID=660469 RepID=A0A9P5CIM0_CRYP1|nr:uncharacterized protein M406DRAFT_47604 [Cryphonectria parasitica EP155]KAF3760804.1 hypothetical protein M406DRAFT_47604 [Cryphonectria parasitica EP155]
MTTPQPMKHAPSQQGKTPQYAAATPGASASTPYSNLHAAFSPHGPKSSPQQVKKSPATGVMMAVNNSVNSQSSNSASAPMNFDSPSAAAFNSMLGMGTFDASLDNMGMGVGGITIPRPSGDEERQKKLEEITHILKQKKGVVSEEGLERLVKNNALDAMWEDRKPYKVLLIAGATIALEIGIKDHAVRTVDLQFAYSGPDVLKHTARAEAILLENLKLAPGQMAWTKQLDNFANNLETLAALDKLSIIDEKKGAVLLTYDAIAGLFESLQKVHDWDVQQLRKEPRYDGKPDEHLRIIAMCERTGRPLMHEKGFVGLRLEYWRNQRYFVPPPAKAERWYKDSKHWAILVSCARRDPMVYQGALRVSNKWIGDEVEVSAPEGLLPDLNWQQPPDVVLPEKPGDELLLTSPRLPEVMFMAILDPPVTLPITVWSDIHQFTGAPVVHPAFMQTFDYLILPVVGHYNPSEPRTVKMKKFVNTRQKDGTSKRVAHENGLFIHKPVYGQTLSELPFSHPQQLIHMLPILRQYAFLRNLLDKSFGGQAEKSTAGPATANDNNTLTMIAKTDEYDTFMNNAMADADHLDSSAVKIDVTLNAHPQPNPKLQIMFPFRERPADVTVDIGVNGVVTVDSTNVVDDQGQVLDEEGNPLSGSSPNPAHTKERLARMLMFFENIDTWCEWIRINVGPE